MKTSQAGIDLIKSFEGCKLLAYKDPVGVWTIGYGHTEFVEAGDKISIGEAEQLLKEDLEKYEKYVNSLNLKLNQNQFDALVSFTYNCGSGSLTRLVTGRTLDEIGEAIPLYNRASGKVLAGLVRRRAAERTLYFTPVSESEDAGNFYDEDNALTPLDQLLYRVGAFPDYDWNAEKMYQKRMPIAIANDIIPYTGTITQNSTLTALAESGRLKRPEK